MPHRRRAGDTVKLRDRVLTLPVMAVLVLSLVWRQAPSLSDALRVVAREGVWEVAPFVLSRPALSQRLRALPAQLFAQLYDATLGRLHQTRRPQPPPSARWGRRTARRWRRCGAS